MPLGINTNDFAAGGDALHGAGTTQEQLQQLNKALEAQQITGTQTLDSRDSSGAPLKVESLDGTLKNVTYRRKDIKLWQAIPKNKAYNTVEEFNQIESYGDDRGGFYQEGELPGEEDTTYVRRSELVKYLGVTRSVTHPMQLVNTMIGNAVNKEAENGTLWLLRKINRSLAYGNSEIVPEEFNGLYKQHQNNDVFNTLEDYFSSEVVIDLRGNTLQEGDLETGAESIIENFGLGNQFFAPPKVISDFVKNFYGNKFVQLDGSQVKQSTVGQSVKNFESQFGDIGFNYDIFLKSKGAKTTASGANSTKAPAAPTADGITPVAVVADAGTKFGSSDAGDYLYAVSALNRHGESALTVLGTAATVTAGDAIDLKFTATAGVYPTTGFAIYRTKKDQTAGTANFYPIFEISTAQLTNGFDGGAAGITRDRNRFLPDTEQAFMIQNDMEVHAFKQLAPLMKMDLAVLSPSYRFMILLYGTPILYAPKKMIRYVNIGKTS